MSKANWIQKTYLFKADEYICSACGASFKKPFSQCPSCKESMRKTKYDASWVDEAEGLSALLDNDW